jgi:hypothetical protein
MEAKDTIHKYSHPSAESLVEDQEDLREVLAAKR